MALASRIAIITGGASGLGRAVATRFTKAGARVALLDLPSDALSATKEELGSNAIEIPANVTSEDEVKKAVERATEEFGGLNTLVQCAGIAPPSKILGKKGVHKLDKFASVVSVNLIGTFNVLRLAAEQMAKGDPVDGERGVIVNTASIAAFEGQVGQCAYASSKAGVVGLTLPAARELAAHGIRVNCIAPGVFMTPMMEGLPPKVQQELGAIVPFPSKLGDPDYYAQLVESIVTNPYLNGEIIRLDGALRMTA